MTENPLVAEARILRTAIAELSKDVLTLTEKLQVSEKTVYKTIRRTKIIVPILALCLLMNIGVTGYLAYTNNKLNIVQERTSSQVLCPLYVLFIKSYHPELQPPDKRAEYEESYKVIRESYAALECT